MSDPLEQLRQTRAAERRQLESAEQPSLSQFWTQPHGVRLLCMKGDVLPRVASVVVDRWQQPVQQRTGSMSAYPAHVGTLLSRRRRGRFAATAAWFSSGWTKVLETTGGTVSTDEVQIGVIAKSLGVPTVGVHYDQFNGNVGLIEADANGAILRHTYMTPVLTEPRGDKWHPAIAADPTPAGLTRALDEIGFHIHEHVLDKFEMVTILSDYAQ